MFLTELSISTLFSNLTGLFLLIGVGFFAVRVGWMQKTASGPLTTLLMKVTLPATVFSSMLRPFESDFLRDALTIFSIAFLAHLTYTGLALLLVRIFRVPVERSGMWCMCCAFCNNGFMGFPVTYAIFGEEGLALAVMLGVAFNLLAYSVGARLVAMDHAGEGRVQMSWRTVMFSAVNLAMALGLVFFCFQLTVPTAILTPIQHLSNVTTPLSMFVTGMNLAGSRVVEVIRDRDVVSASIVRLLVFPLLTWAVLRFLPIANPLVVGVLVIVMSMPSAAISVVLGEQYGGCTELGARTVFLSSLLCIVTIPLVALLL